MPPALRELVAACLEKAPARRPSPSLLLDLLGHGDRAGGAGPTTAPPSPATALAARDGSPAARPGRCGPGPRPRRDGHARHRRGGIRSTVLLTADHLHGEIRGKHWSSPWTDVSRVTVRLARPADRHGRLWQLDAVLREGAPVPKGFKGQGDRGAVLALHFDASEDPRPAPGRLDAGLRRHAGDRYAPDPGLTAYLDRPPPVTSPDAPAPG
ncbi:hypothetical protein [Streptomyces sp. NPDC085466]|uniref:hypothetical protein n=1 Tax=Streptomyces sp. NPDC085466 TaxID=3365725 RepID=UPI0037D88EE5